MFEVRFHGRGGQGVVTSAELLALAGFLEGRHAQAFPSFGSERTGAPVVAFCRFDGRPIRVREPIATPRRADRRRPDAAAPGRRVRRPQGERAGAAQHRAGQGCGEALGARFALDAATRASKGRLIAANATGCLEVFTTPYRETSWQIAWLHSLFGNAPAVASGIAAAMKAGAQDPPAGAGGGVPEAPARYAHLFKPERRDDVIDRLQARADRNIKRFGLLDD
jgi:hypothetical protein